MTPVVEQIFKQVSDAPSTMDVLDWLLGKQKQQVLQGAPVILFGTGGLAKEFMMVLKQHGILPVCFCNSDSSKSGGTYCSLPIITINELLEEHKKSVILVATHTYAAPIKKLLLEKGVRREQILWPTDFDSLKGLYFSKTNLVSIDPINNRVENEGSGDNSSSMETILKNKEKIEVVYNALADQRSKALFIHKLAWSVRNENIKLFTDFLLSFSEPIALFGLVPHPDPGPENYFYFNNDVFSLGENEIYVDVGAYDGDSVSAFLQTCNLNKLHYRKIYAFEPDPENHKALIKNTKDEKNIFCHQLGIWSHSDNVAFISSEQSPTPSGCGMTEKGNITVNTVSLDDFLQGEEVTIIKMDPPGNIIPGALKGAFNTIEKYQPKLVLGVYHSLEAIFEIPYLVHSQWPEYKLYLRHNSWACAETDLYAIR